MSSIRVDLGDWLETRIQTAADNLQAENTAEELAELAITQDPKVRAGYLMGLADGLRGLQQEASPGLLLRKIDVPHPLTVNDPPANS